MSQTVVVMCPVCMTGEVTCSVWYENYGADADGNRGEYRMDGEITDGCECSEDYSDSEYEAVMAKAFAEYHEGSEY